MPGLTLPPFPEDVLTHPLLVIDYELIKKHDEGEIDRLWHAATDLGFWYLKNHGADELVSQMFNMGEETMLLPMEEKMKFEQGDEGRSFGYKAAGANATDETGALDTVEFINVSKDDALSYPTTTHRTYPSTVNARMEGTITPFVRSSMNITRDLLNVLGDRLGLPAGTMDKLHTEKEVSGSETRTIKNPPVGQRNMSADKVAIGAHTDFGSLSFLHNRLGGLQVRVPGSETWQYIKPIPGHAICNLGDAMKILSGGILQSNLHRVVAPPGQQALHERWSLVYFARPGASVILRPQKEDSPMITEAVSKLPPGTYETDSTALDWFARRIKNQRIKNRAGPETWRASRGTEHQPQVV